MAVRARRVGSAFGLALMLSARPASAQSIRGTVVAADGRAPIPHASIVARRSGTGTTSDALGRFHLALASRPDSLVVVAIGWLPATVMVEPADSALVIGLERAPVVISDLITRAPAARVADLESHGRWRMPLAAARTIPPAVETDVYRALAMVPAISFSSPLSARPLVRGYDAQEVTTRIDGFEILNLYHLGRFFSSFPADAADEITVTAAPYGTDQGGSVAGVIDITGRTGRLDGFHAGGGLSYGSLSGYAGGGNDRVRYFANARLFYWKSLDLIPKVSIPYHFEDLYAGMIVGRADRPAGRVTLFATQDKAGEVDDANYLNWDNLLIGSRWRVLDRGATTFHLAGSLAQYRQKGEEVPGLHSTGNFDLTNRFRRSAVAGELISSGPQGRLAIGFSFGWRSIENHISEVAFPGFAGSAIRAPRASLTVDRPEAGGHLDVSRRVGRISAEAAVRFDAAGSARSVQPRFRLRWSPGSRLDVSAAIGRTSRLYHVLAEARSEPDFDFLDFWLGAGDSIPLARVDHASLDLNVDLGPLLGRVSGYLSRGRGIGELRPEHEQRPAGLGFFRFGRSRTRGVEAQLALRGSAAAPRSLSVSYALSHSERDWGRGWVPWSLDRRHQLRAFGQTRSGRVSLFAAADLASGMPLTPIDYLLERPDAPGVPIGPVVRPPEALVYGAENGAATSGTFRIDGGVAYRFGGPGGDRFTLGVSVINLLGTAVAPVGLLTDSADGAFAVDRSGNPLPYRRLFTLPPIPTLTLRAEL